MHKLEEEGRKMKRESYNRKNRLKIVRKRCGVILGIPSYMKSLKSICNIVTRIRKLPFEFRFGTFVSETIR